MTGFGRAWSIGLLGLRGTPVEVEAHAASGLPKFTLIGLPDSVLNEARDRVRAAALFPVKLVCSRACFPVSDPGGSCGDLEPARHM